MNGGRAIGALVVLLMLAACVPTAKPVPGIAERPRPAASMNEVEPAPGAHPAPSSPPVVGWPRHDAARCRGFAEASVEDETAGPRPGRLALGTQRIRALVAGGLARTEVTEELANTEPRTVDARFSFALPRSASVSRFALQRAGKWLDARVVDSDRIALIARGPEARALAAESPGQDDDEFAMRIVDVAAKQRQSVLFAYDEATENDRGREVYRYPISGPPCAVAPLREFSVEVTLLGAPEGFGNIATPNYPAEIRREADRVVVAFDRRAFVPDRDFTVEIERRSQHRVEVQADAAGHASFVLDLPEPSRTAVGAATPPPVRVVVLDKSYHQSPASLALQSALAQHLLARATDTERTRLLACDSACSEWPAQGSTPAERAERAGDWLRGLNPSGTFDFEGALAHATALSEAGKRMQIVYFGSGQVSAGTLDATALVESSARRIAPSGADLRVLGVGPQRDEALLLRVASATNGSYANLSETVPIERAGDELLRALGAAKLTSVQLELPTGLTDPAPSRWPALVVGQSLRVTARASAPTAGTIHLRGKLDGKDYEQSYPFTLNDATPRNPLVERWWARERLREVEQASAHGLFELGTSELSKRAAVATRHTDWLLLESEGARPRGAFAERSRRGLASPPSFTAVPRDVPPTLRIQSNITLRSVVVLKGFESEPERSARQRRIVESLRSPFRYCHERIGAGPSGWFEGRLDFALRVNEKGALESLAAEAEPAQDVRSLFACLRAAAAELKYERPSPGPMELTFSADFAVDWQRGLRAHVAVRAPALFSQGAILTPLVAGDERWRKPSQNGPTLAVLEQATPAAMIATATQLVEAAPGSLAALDLLAAAAGAQQEHDFALATLEAELSVAPEQRELRQRAARAWLARGDERRACAHVRAWAAGGSQLAALNARCRTRWLGEPAMSNEPAESAPLTDGDLEKLETASACSPFKVAVACEDSKRCPTPLVLTPERRLVSAFGRIPGKGQASPLVFWPASFGTYRVLLIGGESSARGHVELSVHLDTRRFDFPSAGAVRTIASVEFKAEAPTPGAVGKPLCDWHGAP